MSFLSLHGLCKSYGATQALVGAGLSVARGSRTAIVGASGSGKTTLLRLVAGFDVPDAGRILLDGEVLADGPAAMPAHRRGVGVVVQEGGLFPHLSIADNIGFGLDRRLSTRGARIAELAEMVGLDAAMLRRKPDELSGGQQQRAALARALACTPRLMLLDEPFSALDTALRASTRKATAELLRQAGITTILVTHDQAEALSFADQVVVMGRGRILQAGAPQELYLRPADAAVAELLGEAIILPARFGAGWAECALGRVCLDGEGPGGRIMLRPEQILLTEAAPGAPGVLAELLSIDFGGAACTAAVRLLADPAVLLDRLAISPAMAAPGSQGRILGITLRGQAHRLV